MAVQCPSCIETDKRIAETLARSTTIGRKCKKCGATINQQRIDFVKKNYGVEVTKCWMCVREEKAEHAKRQAEVDEESRKNPNYRVLKF